MGPGIIMRLSACLIWTKRDGAEFWKIRLHALAACSLGWCVVMWSGCLRGVLGVRAIDESAADI